MLRSPFEKLKVSPSLHLAPGYCLFRRLHHGAKVDLKMKLAILAPKSGRQSARVFVTFLRLRAPCDEAEMPSLRWKAGRGPGGTRPTGSRPQISV